MTTKILQGFVHAQKDSYNLEPNDWQLEGLNLSVWRYENVGVTGMTMIAPATITFEIPDSWDPRRAMVDVLRKEQQKIRAEYVARVQQLEDEIGRYLAIENR